MRERGGSVDELIEAVEALTKVRVQQIDTDDGPTWVTGDPRLQILQDEVYASTSGGGGAGGLKSERMPLSSHVLYKAAVITAQIGDWCRMADVPVTRDPITDLDAWAAHRVHQTEPHEDTWRIQQLHKWAHEIDGMFDQPRPIDITEPCPVCGERSFPDENGDICTWPLKGSTRPFRAECKACGTTWDGPDAMEELAEEIGVEPVAIHAENLIP